ncbi:hypothetical protein TGAMA5MH_01371 [Trichoderma gamsii]|uniref:Uncharacterized protein n=1 Tax=Trichoderma gamsii TaxID=398673 RepID=A0A2K0TPU6_9HYPO|nr:hypothetical protein TGAMA5MH_01371 [Trichoderma gamsii]
MQPTMQPRSFSAARHCVEDPVQVNEYESRQGFALDYKFNISDFTLTVSGLEQPIHIFRDALAGDDGRREEVNATVRAGDTDGANLPWFPAEDALLLFWEIHQEYASVPLIIHRPVHKAANMWQQFDIFLNTLGYRNNALLSFQMVGNDTSSIRLSVPSRPDSSSPSYTYPVRVRIIQVLAPFSLLIAAAFGFITELLGGLAIWIFAAICFGLVVSVVVAGAGMYCFRKRPDELADMVKDELQKLRDSEMMRKWRGTDGGEAASADNSQEQKTSVTETDIKV